MKNKSIPVWIIIICVVGILFYGYIFFFGTHDLNTLKYEVDTDGTILLNREKFTISSGITGYYDTTTETFYIEGVFNNTTKKTYYDVSLNFIVYDLDGVILGNAYAYLDRIGSEESWKFKASYSDIDATDAVNYKLVDMEYYK